MAERAICLTIWRWATIVTVLAFQTFYDRSNSTAAGLSAPIDRIVYGVKSGDRLLVAKRDGQGSVLQRITLKPSADQAKATGAALPAPSYRFPVWHLDDPVAEIERDENRWHPLAWNVRDDFLWYVGILRVGGMRLHRGAVLRMPMERMTFGESPPTAGLVAIPNPPTEAWGPIEVEPKAELNKVPKIDDPHAVARDYSPEFFWVAYYQPLHSVYAPKFFDIWPTASREFLSYSVSSPQRLLMADPRYPEISDNRMFCFRCRFLPVRSGAVSPDGFWWRATWERLGSFHTPFMEPFRATVVGAKTYFITTTGRLYVAGPFVPDGKDEMKLVWPVSKNAAPIVALLRDADNGKSYAFTPTEFFELAETLMPQKCDLGPADKINPDDPMPTVLRCANVLLNVKLIDAKAE